MKKCGLRKAYALGGELGEMNPTELAQFTNNPEVLNAASTRKWEMDEAERQAKYKRQKFMDPVSRQDIAQANRGLGVALQQNGFVPSQTSYEPQMQPSTLADYMKLAKEQTVGFAQGGTIDPDALMREMAAKYGTGSAQPQVAAPTPQPAPAPVQAPQPKPTLLDGLRRLATGNLEGRMKAAGFKQGGTVDGKGYIHGEKGVDKVPAKIAETGEDILVSHGERIVNKKQNAALERLAAEAGMSLDEYLEQSTGEPVGPQMKQGLRGLNKGGFVDDFGNLKRPQGFQAGDRAVVLSQQLAAAAPESQLSSAQAVKPSVQMNPVRGSAPGVMSAEAAAHVADQNRLDRSFAQAQQAAQPRVAQPSRAPYGAPEPVAGPSQTRPVDQTRLQKARAVGLRGLQGLNGYGAVAIGAHDIETANEPAEQVMGALKASGALPGIAGLPGKVALYGDMALGAFGTSGAKLLDKAARKLGGDDYMLDKNREWGTAGTRAESTPVPAPNTAPARPPVGENFDSVDRRPAQERQAAGAQAGLEAKGLRNAQQFLGGEGAAVPEGMRFSSQTESNAPLSTWNSKQDVAAQSIDNRITPENGTGIMSVKQKDGTFKNVAIGQSEYTGADGKPTSDWSNTQQYADGVARANKEKAQLEQIKRERAEFAAFDPSITDPAARDAGLRAVSKYLVDDQLAQKAASDNAKLKLEVAKFNQEERKINNLQGNSERDHRYKVETDDDKRLDDVLKSRATVDGKLDGKKYADYQRFVGNFKAKNAGENGKHRAKDILDAMELWEAYGEDDGSIFRRVAGQGSDMPTGLRPKDGLLWGQSWIDPRTGRQISGTRVSELSPGARAIFEQNRNN